MPKPLKYTLDFVLYCISCETCNKILQNLLDVNI